MGKLCRQLSQYLMTGIIFSFIIGWLVVQTICVIWFYSPFRLSISPILFNTVIYSFDEFETLILLKYPVLGKLLSCYICFSFWASFIVGSFGSFLIGVSLWFGVLAAFTYPAICYLYKSIVDKKL